MENQKRIHITKEIQKLKTKENIAKNTIMKNNKIETKTIKAHEQQLKTNNDKQQNKH